MLRIRTAVSGAFFRISRVACTPSRPGIAISMTMTRGCSSCASLMASWPLVASPTTRISGSSSSMRRNPLRTRLWSSTSRTVISLLIVIRQGHIQPHQGAAFAGTQHFESPLQQFGALAHGRPPDAAARAAVLGFGNAAAAVLDLEVEPSGQESEAHDRGGRPRVAGQVIERFGEHAIDVNGHAIGNRGAVSLFLVSYLNSSLLLEDRQIPVD